MAHPTKRYPRPDGGSFCLVSSDDAVDRIAYGSPLGLAELPDGQFGVILATEEREAWGFALPAAVLEPAEAPAMAGLLAFVSAWALLVVPEALQSGWWLPTVFARPVVADGEAPALEVGIALFWQPGSVDSTPQDAARRAQTFFDDVKEGLRAQDVELPEGLEVGFEGRTDLGSLVMETLRVDDEVMYVHEAAPTDAEDVLWDLFEAHGYTELAWVPCLAVQASGELADEEVTDA